MEQNLTETIHSISLKKLLDDPLYLLAREHIRDLVTKSLDVAYDQARQAEIDEIKIRDLEDKIKYIRENTRISDITKDICFQAILFDYAKEICPKNPEIAFFNILRGSNICDIRELVFVAYTFAENKIKKHEAKSTVLKLIEEKDVFIATNKNLFSPEIKDMLFKELLFDCAKIINSRSPEIALFNLLSQAKYYSVVSEVLKSGLEIVIEYDIA